MMQKVSLSFVSLLVLYLAQGCTGSSSGAQLVGTWEADAKSMMEQMKAEGNGPPAGMEQMAAAMMKSMAMTMVFNADGTASMTVKAMGQEQKTQGKWEVLSSTGDDKMQIRLTRQEDGKEEVDTVNVAFEGPDTCTLTNEGKKDPPMVLTRSK